MVDRSSARHTQHAKTPRPVVRKIVHLRWKQRLGPVPIATRLGMPASTVHAVLKRCRLNRLSHIDRVTGEPARRYERQRPGELIHVDVKRLARISKKGAGHRVLGHRKSQFKVGPRRLGATGWEFVHVCVDDATRLAYAEVLADERAPATADFLRRAVKWFSSMGITVERVMTDNGPGYRSKLHALACRELGLKHLFTQPYRPRTNGKAERFIQTLQNRWAYGAIYGSSAQRTAALPGWLAYYNFTRRHGSLAKKAPATRLAELEQRHE
jgi:transposase InsO family protein